MKTMPRNGNMTDTATRNDAIGRKTNKAVATMQRVFTKLKKMKAPSRSNFIDFGNSVYGVLDAIRVEWEARHI